MPRYVEEEDGWVAESSESSESSESTEQSDELDADDTFSDCETTSINDQETEKITASRRYPVKRASPEDSRELEKLREQVYELEDAISSLEDHIRRTETNKWKEMQRDRATKKFAGKYMIYEMSDANRELRNNGIPFFRRFANLASTVHVEFSNKRMQIWKQFLWKKFDKRDLSYKIQIPVVRDSSRKNKNKYNEYDGIQGSPKLIFAPEHKIKFFDLFVFDEPCEESNKVGLSVDNLSYKNSTSIFQWFKAARSVIRNKRDVICLQSRSIERGAKI